MNKYKVTVKRLDRRRHSGFGYGVIVTWSIGGTFHGGERTSVSYTKWGANREAKKIIRDNELGPEKMAVVEEYEV